MAQPAVTVHLPDWVGGVAPSINLGFAGLGLLALLLLVWGYILQIKRGQRADADAIQAYRDSIALKDGDNSALRGELAAAKQELRKKDEQIAAAQSKLFDEVTSRQDRFGQALRALQEQMAVMGEQLRLATEKHADCDAELAESARQITHLKHLLVSKGVVVDSELALTIR